MIHFVGAGPGAPDLITVRGKALLESADIIIYAGSLVNRELLDYAKPECEIYNSAGMSFPEIIEVMTTNSKKEIVRLHTGDPSIYGAIKEQTDALAERGIEYDICPGVSSMFGAAAALGAEYTVPGVSQSVIITRMAGRTPVPEKESIELLARHGASMVIFLSAGMLEELSKELIRGGYEPDTPAAIVYKATWTDEKKLITTVEKLAETGAENGINKTALVLVGDFLKPDYERSRLYAPEFAHSFRKSDTWKEK